MPSALNLTSWSLPKKILFRFFFTLLVLYVFVNNNGAFLYADQLFYYPTEALHLIIPWFSAHILNYNYDFSIFPLGSGDTSYNYVQLLFLVLLSFSMTMVWSVIDHKRENYSVLYYWLIVLVRFYLAFMLMQYGVAKIIQLQFPQPHLSRLLQPFGDASPMGLAWTFLGFSKGYNLFMGIVEVSSVLLLFRRTMVAGAFLSLAASVHVMAMNYFFDVPVKILSTTLVIMCLFILAPFMVSIGKFFFSEQTQELKIQKGPSYKKRWQLITAISFKYLIIVWTVCIMLASALSQQYGYGALAPRATLYGIYTVQVYKLNGKEILPLITDSTRWRQLVIDREGTARVRLMDDSFLSLDTKIDVAKKEIELQTRDEQANRYKFIYELRKDSTLILLGHMEKDSVAITLKQFDTKKFRLMNRGFHWINERPYNR